MSALEKVAYVIWRAFDFYIIPGDSFKEAIVFFLDIVVGALVCAVFGNFTLGIIATYICRSIHDYRRNGVQEW